MAVELKCSMCGGPKERGHGRRYCDACQELAAWRAQRKRRRPRKLCAGCKRPKPPGTGRRFCDACRNTASLVCTRCGEDPPRAPAKRLCEKCYAISKDRTRWRHRKYNRKRRVEAADAVRQEYREYKLRRKADPELHAHDLETKRLRYRMLAQAEGREVRRSPVTAVPLKCWLPGRPFAAAIDKLSESTDLSTVCDLASIAERQVTRWRTGEGDISFEEADRLMTRLDLFWWEVWNEESVRLPLFVVSEYTTRMKLARGKYRRYRNKDRSIPYGDAGPDVEALGRVSRLMTGQAVAA